MKKISLHFNNVKIKVSTMLTQSGTRKNSILKKCVIGAHPIIQFYLDKLRVEDTIESFIQHDARQTLSTAKTLCVLIHNILTSPLPMYEISDWTGALDEESLGLNKDEGALIQDDRIGGALDRFYEGRHKDVFFRLALKAIKIFDLDCSQIHQDTTTITFSGQYRGWSAIEKIAYGKNKDHRPDLKQLVLGLSITADGAVPLIHKVYDGNQSDDRLHPENHQRLRKLLNHSDFIYVADSKLSTDDNLAKITSCGGRVVSIMPRTWKEDKTFRELVIQGKIRFQHLLSKRNNRNPDSKIDRYQLAQGKYTTSQGYHLHWIFSTQKAEQDAQTRSRHIQKALGLLAELQSKLNRYSLKERKTIQENARKILKACQCVDFITFSVSSQKHFHLKHQKQGRPSKTATPGKKIWSELFSLSFEVDEKMVNKEAMIDGIFPLITNFDDPAYSPKRILEIYKFQPFLEKRHSQLKTWQAITPVLLKKSERVVALLHMHVMALMIATLIERNLRRAMNKNKIPSLPIYPEARSCPYPTVFDVVRLFKGVEKYEVEDGDRLNIFPAQLSKVQKEVLRLLEVPISLYQ